MNLNEVTKGILCNSVLFDLETAPVLIPSRTGGWMCASGLRRGGRMGYVADVFHSQPRYNDNQWQATGEVGQTHVGAAGTDAHMRT